MEEQYLIWSNEHRAWWRMNSSGYTVDLEYAGRYSRQEAISTCVTSRDGWGEHKIPSEIPVSETDALDCQARWEHSNGPD